MQRLIAWRGQVLAALVVSLCALFVWMSWRSVTINGPIWFDGPMAGIMKAMELGRLYRPEALQTPAYTILTHTPLSYWLSYAVWSQFHTLGALRLLNVFHTLLCACLILWAVRGLGSSRWIAPVTAAASFLLCQPVFSWSQMARSPDSLETLLSLGVVVATWRAKPGGTNSLVVGVLLALAILAKQTALITLVPALAWHHWKTGEWRTGIARIVGAGLLVLLVVGILQWTSDGGFWFNTVTANIVRHDWAKAVVYVFLPLGPYWIWTVLVWGAGRNLAPAASAERVFQRWFAVSFWVGMVTCFKDGSDANYFFDLSAAAAILLGLTLQRVPRPQFVPVIAVATLLMVVAGDMPYFTRNSDLIVRQAQDTREALRQIPGDILADEASLPMSLGRGWWWNDPFLLREMARQHRWNSKPLAALVRRKAFAALMVRDIEIWPDRIRAEVKAAYHPDRKFPSPELTYVLYLPNR